MLRQDRDFSTIDAIKRQFQERWNNGGGKNTVICMGLFPGPNKADDICGKTTVTGKMQRGSTVYSMDNNHTVYLDVKSSCNSLLKNP
jgi:hypothetical protein